MKRATMQQKDEIYRIWKSVFSFDDFGSIDYYFKHHFNGSSCYIIEKEDKIVSTLSSHKHPLMLNGKLLNVSFISGVATIPSQRGQGLMKQMMTDVLEELSYQDLITVIQAYNPELYKPFGFEMVYYRNQYLLTRSQVNVFSTDTIYESFLIEELLKIYLDYVQHFDGYFVRNKPYYENFILEKKAMNMKIVVCRDKNKQAIGYMCYSVFQDKVVIDEIIYQNATALMKLLSFCFNIKNNVEVTLSSQENLNKLIPTAIVTKVGYMMARVNDYELLNRLYNNQVATIQDVFKMSKKPLFIHEDW